MLARTGFPEYLESIAIGPNPDFLRDHTDLCDIANAFPNETNVTYLWKKIATSVDPLEELREFTKHFMVDGPDFSEEFILHFAKKVDMLPPSLRDQIKFEIDDALDKATKITPKGPYDPLTEDVATRTFNKTRAVNDDPDFLNKLANMMNSCNSPCNYFSPVTDKVGAIFDFSRINSINASMPQDANLDTPPPIGMGLNVLNKIPRVIQDTLMEAYTSAKLLADTAKGALTSPGTTKALQELAKKGVSADSKGIPHIGSTSTSVFQEALALNSSLMTKVKRNMGDCFRIADFLNRYNAFDEDMNLAAAKKKVFKLQIPDASMGGAKRTWSGTAQGVSGGTTPGSEVHENGIKPEYALRPKTTGDARNYDDAVKSTPECPPGTPMGPPATTVTSGPNSGSTAAGGNTPLNVDALPGKLKPLASDFVAAGKKYNIDPNFLAAISMNETGNGTSKAFVQGNNAMGISNASGPVYGYSSPGASIDYMAKRLADPKGYYKNAQTIGQIGNIYSPIGAKNDFYGTNSSWVPTVGKFYNKLTGKDPNSVVK